MIELETQTIQILGLENTNPTNLAEENQNGDIEITFLVFNLCW